MAIKIKVHAAGLLDYAKEGKAAVTRIRASMRTVLNAGRTEARRRINSDFIRRTGVLRRKARSMQTKVTVKAAEIKGQVVPLPRLLNIFEHGATLAKGRGHLRARPVVAPGQKAIDAVAFTELNKVLSEVGK